MTDNGWTKTPNFIYDLMPQMKEAELKVVLAVARQTSGWQRDRAKMRMADLKDETGLSHPSVNTGIKAAMERGILGRDVNGESFVYWLIDPEDTSVTVKIFNTEEAAETVESQNSLQSDVKNLNNDSVKNFDTNKRNINTNKPEEKKESSADAPPKPKEHAANVAYRELHNRWPSTAQMKIIAERDPPIGDWVRAIRAWAEAGYKPTNIQGMLDWAFNPSKITERVYRNGANNGSNQRHSAAHSGQADGGDTPTLDPEIQRRMDEHRAKRKAEGSRYYQ